MIDKNDNLPMTQILESCRPIYEQAALPNNPIAEFYVQELLRGKLLDDISARFVRLGVAPAEIEMARDLGYNYFRSLESKSSPGYSLSASWPVQDCFSRRFALDDLAGNLRMRHPHSCVSVIDGFLSDGAFAHVQQALAKVPMEFGKKTKFTPGGIEETGFWFASLLAQPDPLKQIDLARASNFHSFALLDQLWSHATSLAGAKNLTRVYTNAQSYGTDPLVHRDDPMFLRNVPDRNAVPKTILIYMNDHWDKDWGGETSFFDDSGELIASVLPKKGRAVIFDGTVWHGARPLSRYFEGMRKILVFKTAPFSPANLSLVHDWVRALVQGIPHSRGTFSDHLLGTAAILHRLAATPGSRCDNDIVLAGMCHALYGTHYFQSGISVSRELLREKIGERAERLVYEFSTLQNRTDKLLQGELSCSPDDYLALLLIEYANMVEQSPRFEKIREKGTVAKIRAVLASKFGVHLPAHVEPWPQLLVS